MTSNHLPHPRNPSTLTLCLLLALPIALSTCSREATCRHDGTCERGDGADGSVDDDDDHGGESGSGGDDVGGTPGSDDVSSTDDQPDTDDAGGGSGTEGNDGGSQDCDDAACGECTAEQGCGGVTPRCLVAATPKENRCVECLLPTDCPMAKPLCVDNQCIACTLEIGCGELTCALGATAPENTCVGCITSNQCNAGVCDNAECIPCKSNNDEGCNDEEPKCLAGNTPIQNTCVECLGTDDCSAPDLACQDHICTACSTDDHTGCNLATPYCKATGNIANNTCVECLNATQCDDDLCVNDQCLPCNTANDQGCSGATPLCKPGATNKQNQCVECLGGDDCEGNSSGALCINDECVECAANTDCTSATASKCTNSACVPCQINTDCSHISGKGICDSGTCVACTVEDETPCGANSCNPATNTCTNTPRGSRSTCESCIADSECLDLSVYRCVPMSFKGTPRPGGFCLRREASGCTSPYGAVLINAASLSGVSAEPYCGINQQAVTCEAVLDLVNGTTCNVETDCGNGQGGLCKKVGAFDNRCTYSCGDVVQCPSGRACSEPTPWCH